MEDYEEEMSKMMTIFEQKAQEIMRLQNNGALNNGHQQRRLEINTGSYDSTNPGSDCNFSENIKNKKYGREQSIGHKNVNNQEARANSKNKNKGNSNVYVKGNNGPTKKGFVNKKENSGNKI